MLASAETRAARTTAQEIRFWMSAPVITVQLDSPVSEVLALMHEHSVRRLPVVNAAGELRGIVTAGDTRGADVMRVAGTELVDIADALRHTPVSEVMTERPLVVTPVTTLREAALLMLDYKVGGLPVIDDQEQVVGIITESDLFEALVCYLDSATAG